MFGKNKLLNTTLLIAVVTVVSYGVALIYQQAYYRAFDIDTTAFSLSLAPELILYAAFIIMGVVLIALVMYLYFKVINRVLDKVEPHFPVAMDVFAVLIAVGSALLLWNRSWLNAFKDFMEFPLLDVVHYTWILVTFLVIMIAYLALKVHFILQRRKKTKEALLASYRKVTEELMPTIEFPHISLSIPSWVPPLLLGIILLPVLPIAMAQGLANEKTSFTALVSKSSASSHIHQLVIGKTSDGLIVKRYDSDKKSFQPGFTIVDAGAHEFRPYELKK